LSGNEKITVIVIDDDMFLRRALKIQLEILGFDVLVFYNAESMLSSEFPKSNCCLLSDVYLTGMSGAELSRHLVAAEIGLPTILMSGHDDKQTKRLIRKARPIATLLKPFDPDALLAALRKAIG
jgi:two-component system, NtrC family, C4-dicarboxylate transport response regulator DctD